VKSSIVCFFVILAFLNSSHTSAVSIQVGSEGKPPYAIDQQLTEPRIFGEGIISTPDNEFGGVFTPDGKEFYFSKSIPVSYFYTICVSRFVNGKWTTPEIAPFSGHFRDFDPVISPDGSKMLFISDRPVKGEQKIDYDVWIMDRTAGSWSEPRNLGAPINSEGEEWFASMSANGTIYFANSGRADSKGGMDIYRSRLIDGKYAEPENLGPAINTQAEEGEPAIAPDESFMIFASGGRPESPDNWDLYISYNVNGSWTPAKHLGPMFNTSARDYSPRLTPDGKYLFFTSERNFSTKPLQKPLTYSELETNLHSILNGNGNIYQIDLAAVDEGMKFKH